MKKVKKTKGGNTELRLKVKVPEGEIVRQNIEKLMEYRGKNTVKRNVMEGIVGKK